MIDGWINHRQQRFWPCDQVGNRIATADLTTADIARLVTSDTRHGRTAPLAAIKPSRRAFERAQSDACVARIYRAKAAQATCPGHRFRLIQTARQCEARVRYAADMAMLEAGSLLSHRRSPHV